MEKPSSLRAALSAADPQLDRDAERLSMWVEEGRIRSPMTESRGFTWEYTLNITITDLTLHPSVLFLAINDWLRTNQPDLLSPQTSAGFHFEADIIDPQTIDLHVTLKLSEQVVLTTDANGKPALQHIAEPDMSWLTGGPPLTPAASPLKSIVANDAAAAAGKAGA